MFLAARLLALGAVSRYPPRQKPHKPYTMATLLLVGFILAIPVNLLLACVLGIWLCVYCVKNHLGE